MISICISEPSLHTPCLLNILNQSDYPCRVSSDCSSIERHYSTLRTLERLELTCEYKGISSKLNLDYLVTHGCLRLCVHFVFKNSANYTSLFGFLDSFKCKTKTFCNGGDYKWYTRMPIYVIDNKFGSMLTRQVDNYRRYIFLFHIF